MTLNESLVLALFRCGLRERTPMGFSPLNLFGLTGVLAKTFGKGKKNDAVKNFVDAPAPVPVAPLVDPNQEVKLGGPAAPPSTPLATSEATVAANAAREKARKRATAGNTLLTGSPAGRGMNPQATLNKKSLIGYALVFLLIY